MSLEYQGPRIAPEKKEREPNAVDVVVVIPAMNEGVNIVDTLESIASQTKVKNRQLIQGSVVVINNRPDAPAGVLKSNMETYILLQGIRNGCRVSIKGRPDLTEKIRRIQDSGMPIEVIDAFSEGHAHTESNVGRARKIGTDHALGLVKGERSAIVSTDADTTLDSSTLGAIQQVFETEAVDAMPLELGRNMQGLDERSKQAYELYRLYWNLDNQAQTAESKIHALQTEGMPFSSLPSSVVSSSAVWLSGGGTAFTAEAYRKSGGYRPIGREEDTLLAADMASAGMRLGDLTKKYPELLAYTRPRISLRTERGFGHTIAHWDKPGMPFGDIEVDDPDVMKQLAQFYREVDALLSQTGITEVIAQKQVESLCAAYHLPEESRTALSESFIAWGGVPNKVEHFRFMEQARNFFKQMKPGVPLRAVIEKVEELNGRYWKAQSEANWVGTKIGVQEEDWRWEHYHDFMLRLLEETGVKNDAGDFYKLRALIASDYLPKFEPVVQDFMLVCVNTVRTAMLTWTDVPESEDKQKLREAKNVEGRTPEEFWRLMLCQKIAAQITLLQNCQRMFSDKLSAETTRGIKDKLGLLRQEYTDMMYANITALRI